MDKKGCDIRVGTSGWHYGHWQGLFYPEGLPKSKWFEYYCREFDTVEINNTFYHLPKESSFKRWYEQSPREFVYAVKASRYITHIKRLKDAADAFERFWKGMRILNVKLGPVLYQLPPSFHKDLERLEDFAKLLPKDVLNVFEFRHKSWFSEDTYELLDGLGLGFCIHDMRGVVSPRVITSDMIYVRFHGLEGRYAGSYSKNVLADWVKWMKQSRRKVRSIWAYFNNDAEANAVRNAKTLREQLL